MNIPSEIKVGPHIYTIVTDATEDSNGNCGATYPDLTRINISPNISTDAQRLTVWHELKHACANFAGVDPKTKLTEEEWITRTSAAELALLRENQGLVRYLLS